MSRPLVYHVLDTPLNLDTPYFWSLATRHDPDRYEVGFCTIAPRAPMPLHPWGDVPIVDDLATNTRRFSPRAAWRLAGRLRARKAALVHAHFFYPTLTALAGARLAGAPMVFTRHHSDHNSRLGKRWHTRLDTLAARGADQVIAVSEATKRIMVEQEGVPAASVSVVHNGLDPLRRPGADEIDRLCAELGAGPPLRVCLVLARLHEEKGHRYLFEALPELLQRFPNLLVLVVGDGPHRRVLESQVEVLGLRRHVRFLGRRNDVPALLALAEVMVLPSLAESFGFVLVEAMSLGVPIVATEVGGIPELIGANDGGLLVPPGDPGALGGAIAAILEDPALAQRLSAVGPRRSAAFSLERMMRAYEAVYDRVLGGEG